LCEGVVAVKRASGDGADSAAAAAYSKLCRMVLTFDWVEN
jgi:hypothetical protein